MLHLTAAQLAAREGRSSDADTHLTEARELAARTGERNYWRWHFGPANVTACRLWVRQDAAIDWSEGLYSPDKFGVGVGGTLFEANEIVFRCEGRFGFAVPPGVVEVDLTAL